VLLHNQEFASLRAVAFDDFWILKEIASGIWN
jgi:hypothetical protein